MAEHELLEQIKALIERGQDTDEERQQADIAWKSSILGRLDLVNGTVKAHALALALLEQSTKRQGSDLEAVCSQVRALELSQAKAAGIGAVVGATIAALPQLITVLKTVLK